MLISLKIVKSKIPLMNGKGIFKVRRKYLGNLKNIR
jgi:hypothetical protein